MDPDILRPVVLGSEFDAPQGRVRIDPDTLEPRFKVIGCEPWSDQPECVAPSIRSFCITWNDALPDADRTRLLRPFLTG